MTPRSTDDISEAVARLQEVIDAHEDDAENNAFQVYDDLRALLDAYVRARANELAAEAAIGVCFCSEHGCGGTQCAACWSEELERARIFERRASRWRALAKARREEVRKNVLFIEMESDRMDRLYTELARLYTELAETKARLADLEKK